MKEFPPIDWKNLKVNDGIDREFRKVTQFENDCKYEGEWIKGTDIMDGRGIVLWPNGNMCYQG